FLGRWSGVQGSNRTRCQRLARHAGLSWTVWFARHYVNHYLAQACTAKIVRLRSMEPERDPPKLCKLAIDIEGLTLRIKNRVLIEGFSFQLPAGTRVGITGPSGCGKTTFLRNIVGRQITPPSSVDRVEFCGDRVGYVPQQGCLLPWYS